jgi:hypothetical protein
MHERHFVLQQIVHINLSYFQSATMTSGHRDSIFTLIPDEHNAAYIKMMANTQARKAQEAADKKAAEEKAATEKAKRDAENSWSNQIKKMLS